MNNQILIDTFRSIAIDKGDGDNPHEKDSDLFLKLSDAYRAIEQADDLAMQLFCKLLEDESSHVKLWVAAQLLFNGNLMDGRTIEVLKELSSLRSFCGMSASMVLKQYNDGTLKSPL